MGRPNKTLPEAYRHNPLVNNTFDYPSNFNVGDFVRKVRFDLELDGRQLAAPTGENEVSDRSDPTDVLIGPDSPSGAKFGILNGQGANPNGPGSSALNSGVVSPAGIENHRPGRTSQTQSSSRSQERAKTGWSII